MTTAYFDCQAGASETWCWVRCWTPGWTKRACSANSRSWICRPGNSATCASSAVSSRPGWSILTSRIAGGHHAYADIDACIAKADLGARVKAEARQVFRRIAEAEAATHGTDVDEVEFHEVGAADSVLDVVGAVVGFDLLTIDRVVVSPINTGSGWVQTAHGRLPVPAPATARLLAGSGAIAYGSDVKFELLTPTGAAVLTRAEHEFGPLPAMRVQRTGYGAGYRQLVHSQRIARHPRRVCRRARGRHRNRDRDQHRRYESRGLRVRDRPPVCRRRAGRLDGAYRDERGPTGDAN